MSYLPSNGEHPGVQSGITYRSVEGESRHGKVLWGRLLSYEVRAG